MGSIVKFSAINSKVKAMMGKMISGDQYLKLLKCKDFKSTVKVLKEDTSYGELLGEYNLEKIHRGNLEIILNRYYTSIYSKFINYFDGEYRKLIKVFFVRWEIEDLKIIIRGKYLGLRCDEIENKLIARSSLNTINYDYLLALKNTEEVIDGLKGSIYYKSLKNLARGISEKGLFRIETELDFVYFMSVRRELKHLDNENKEVVHSILGLEADLLNLGWIYRGKIFYNIPSEELFNYTIYNGYKLSKENIRKLCYINNMEEFYNIIEKTPYAKIYEKDDFNSIEKRQREFQKKYFKKNLRENKTNISMAMSYLAFYRIEIKDIISIVEQKRYDMDMNEGINYVSVTL
ncbi:V-type ATPase subunit [Clostridium sp. CM028]|uniref:V-type ATPase subunit n=1 Tax=unclassified Clostridium TaxID=2614128 RepID=UPI001C0CEACF|nr:MULTISPECIES: V-type ATPase subunit [unclassified Clostridium]MBU3090694.1 V-type ATPase subunit [Clostridium sp. CF011]MBW9144312.1 V-type ATPase subunit [Clostridium sp. CM027]MBW9147378.1 V-type ATPase subunit [Clostridium sp. CM028]UVE41054.1 V-type ATPase subunit [Clostridium sp. CM027]WAG70045.1 V-type ATPase subunit [Clostridium sp. CF011]